MYQGKSEMLWVHTSHIMATITNLFADKDHQVLPEQINPYIAKKDDVLPISGFEFLCHNYTGKPYIKCQTTSISTSS